MDHPAVLMALVGVIAATVTPSGCPDLKVVVGDGTITECESVVDLFFFFLAFFNAKWM